MKRLLLIFAFALGMLSAGAYTVLDTHTGQVGESATAPKFRKSVEQLHNGVKITFTFDSLMLIQDQTVEGASYFGVEGLPLSSTECQGWLPYTTDLILVPDTTACSVQILDDDFIDYKVKLSPARRTPVDNDDNPEVDLKPRCQQIHAGSDRGVSRHYVLSRRPACQRVHLSYSV